MSKKIILYFFLIILNTLPVMSQKTFERELISKWKFKSKDSFIDWKTASVPGCVHTDLLDNNLILDPFYRLNEQDVQWVDKKDWIYETLFIIPEDIKSKQNISLKFKGLDTYAKVYLNNNLILTADNMFREWEVECSTIINRYSENSLRIEFESPLLKMESLYDVQSFHLPAPNDQSQRGGMGDKKLSVLTRKAGYMYGWDWGPRLVTLGIWRPISIIGYDNVQISDVFIFTKNIQPSVAEMAASVQIKTKDALPVTVEFSTEKEVLYSTNTTFNSSKNTFDCSFQIKNPTLWWCNGLGQPYLYTIYCTLKQGGTILDRKEVKTGIRTIELIHENDNEGKSFYFKLNGIPVFMKGANYIPQDNFPSRVSNDKYVKTIKNAVDAHMNMLRVWGGGIYENDIFYRLCDEQGILVWQDFMFACSLYPADKAFIDNIKNEISDNVRRLRNHPCIALWCGNNEIHTAWNDWGWKREANAQSVSVADNLYKDYETIFHKIIPQVLKETDTSRAYWPSSPMASYDKKAGDLNSGDMHYWDVWHFEKPFNEYEQNVGRFMSEYGFQSFPEIRTIDQYTKPDDRLIESDVMVAHQRHPRGNQIIKNYLQLYYKEPKSFEHMLYIGQILQAEGIKIAIDAHRGAKPHCMGTLYWQLNDCWPVASWSSIDYYGRWKALHYFVKKAFSPLCINAKINNNTLQINVINDLLTQKEIPLDISIISFNGNVMWQTNKTIVANGNIVEHLSIDLNESNIKDENLSKSLIVVKAVDDKSIHPSIVYFKQVKDLELVKPTIETTIQSVKDGYKITVTTNVLVKNLYLQTLKNGYFSDNYFDLLPGETKSVLFTTQSKTFDKTTLQLLSVYDTYK